MRLTGIMDTSALTTRIPAVLAGLVSKTTFQTNSSIVIRVKVKGDVHCPKMYEPLPALTGNVSVIHSPWYSS
jgi:hypothetical protein